MREAAIATGAETSERTDRSSRRLGKWVLAAGLTLMATPPVVAFVDLAAGWVTQDPNTYVAGVTDEQILDVVGRDVRDALPAVVITEVAGVGMVAAGMAANRRQQEA